MNIKSKKALNVCTLFSCSPINDSRLRWAEYMHFTGTDTSEHVLR